VRYNSAWSNAQGWRVLPFYRLVQNTEAQAGIRYDMRLHIDALFSFEVFCEQPTD
jgi:hypothetical protein